MLEIIKDLKKLQRELSAVPEQHEIGNHVVTTEFICSFGYRSQCSRHKAYVDGKACGWYEEGPAKSWLNGNWSIWILDSIYFTDPSKVGGRYAELPYSDPPVYSPVCDTAEEFLALAIKYKLIAP